MRDLKKKKCSSILKIFFPIGNMTKCLNNNINFMHANDTDVMNILTSVSQVQMVSYSDEMITNASLIYGLL